ncbi:TetR/AcrR family transcriptional regulator [Paenibacillus sepulcri]|uniref:TetR/AcrR family transcriptional regulator n=1 Tax=Paenibacillus sepulcri TaxID=359917 RepID=A0ABS7CE98_9BACL|nr:TetR/AcrR family transcriptional regulator [Paenibacillus sepulcri]
MKETMEQWFAELEKSEAEAVKMTEKQSKILQAAIEVFAEKGFAAASTNEIAQRAGVAEGTIFRHYKTKKDLLLSIVAPVMTKLIAPFVLRDFNKVLDVDYDRYELFLRAVIANRIEFLRNHMNVFKILIQEIPFHPELQEQFRKNILSKVLERMNLIVDKFKSRGQLMEIPNLTVIRLTMSAIIGYVITRAYNENREDAGWDDEFEREETISFIIRGLSIK